MAPVRRERTPTLNSAPPLPAAEPRRRLVRRSPWRRSIAARVALLAFLFIPGVLDAQLFERATVIENARVRLSEDRVVDGVTVVIKSGRIDAIGIEVDKPFLSCAIDATGGVLTNGFIALASDLALAPSRKADPRSVMADGVDRYDRDAIALALSGGVTTVCLVPSRVTGIQGVASVVTLAPGENGGHLSVLERESALCIDLGSDDGALARLRTLAAIRKTFEAALAHRESLDLYDESLEEYLEKIAPAEGEGGEKEGKKSARAEEGGEKGKGKSDDEKDAPKPPKEPSPRDDLTIVLRALDRELPVRITAHRSADLWNAIELAKEYDLDLVLVGASEAHLVIDAIVEAEATVLLAPAPAGLAAERGADRRRVADLPALLTRHEVPWHVLPGANLHEVLADTVRLTRGSGTDVFTALGWDPARFLGLGRSVGRLGRGARADLVLWSADPFTDPTARVRQVWCGGRSVFRDDAVVLDDPEETAAPAGSKEAL